MLNRDELTKIAKIKGNSDYFVSCYLNVDPVSNIKGDYMIHIKNMFKEALEAQDKETRKKVKPDLQKIDSYIFANKRGFKKGLAIISSIKANYWKEFHFSIGLRNEIVIDKTPYVKPLFNIMDLNQRYAVMIIDKESARLFAVHLGEIEEYREIYTDNIPGKHKKGGWFSLSERSYERHIDYHVYMHVKDVIQELEKMLSTGNIARLVIGGSEDALSIARSHVRKEVSDKIIGTFAISIGANVNEILSRVETVINAFEQERDTSTVNELWTKTMKKENAVLGIDNVLAALHEGRVMRLLYVKDHRDTGRSCDGCGFLTSQDVERCPYCKVTMKKVDYIIDLAAQKAIEQGAIVEVITQNEKLVEAGSIGAFLRY